MNLGLIALYTQYIKTSIDPTMIKIRNEQKKIIYKIYDLKKNYFESLENARSCRSTTMRSYHANSTDSMTQWPFEKSITRRSLTKDKT
jgi:hypothetical protein